MYLKTSVHGGTTTSHVIQQPLVLIEEMYTNFMWIAEGEPDKVNSTSLHLLSSCCSSRSCIFDFQALLVHIDSIRIPEENYEGYDGINKIGLFVRFFFGLLVGEKSKLGSALGSTRQPKSELYYEQWQTRQCACGRIHPTCRWLALTYICNGQLCCG